MFREQIRRLWRDRGGGVAVMLAMCLVPLTLAGLGAVDITRVASAKSRLQDALDAAALTAARDSVADPTSLQDIGRRAFNYNMQDNTLMVAGAPTFTLNEQRVVIADAHATVPGTFMMAMIEGFKDPVVNAHTEVNSSGMNIEVSLVVDVTGSMNETLAGDSQRKISALKDAAAQLIDTVIQDQQPPEVPFFSKMALVPYSAAINPNTDGADFATLLRGAIRNGTSPTPGLRNYTFKSAAGSLNTFPVTSCVTERTDGHKFDDVSYVTSPLGRHYAEGGCPSAAIHPLTTDKNLLKAQIAALNPGGSTAGHLGLAWGWYLVSPTFMATYPSIDARPSAYGTDKLIKVVVLMTDGNFNMAYFNGVAARDSKDDPTGDGQVDVGANPNFHERKAANGTSLQQAAKLCDAMKKKKIIVYTVGLFDGRYPSAEKLMSDCATDQAHVYLPRSGVQLKDAFASIGRDITKLRLSR